ncbi:MAG: hypothetical protein M1818_002390 [Claussenomyces sp. TS43310]|nr:MAG: hypothetical protein M1818_002390 [Claussenomyces sp. TS43310]
MTEPTVIAKSRREIYGAVDSAEDDEELDSEGSTSVVDSEGSEDGVYVVDKVLSERTESNGNTYYLIKWEGYSVTESTWEPKKHVLDPGILNDWEIKKSRVNAGLSLPFDEKGLLAQQTRMTKGEQAKQTTIREDKASADKTPLAASSNRSKSSNNGNLDGSIVEQWTGTQNDDTSEDDAVDVQHGRKRKRDQRQSDSYSSDESMLLSLARKKRKAEKEERGTSRQGRSSAQITMSKERQGKATVQTIQSKTSLLLRGRSKPLRPEQQSSRHERPSKTGYQGSAHRGSMRASRLGGTRRATGDSQLGVLTTRTSSTAVRGGIRGFASSIARDQPLRKRNIVEVLMADPKKEAKHYVNLRTKRKVELAGRALIDREPNAAGFLAKPSEYHTRIKQQKHGLAPDSTPTGVATETQSIFTDDADGIRSLFEEPEELEPAPTSTGRAQELSTSTEVPARPKASNPVSDASLDLAHSPINSIPSPPKNEIYATTDGNEGHSNCSARKSPTDERPTRDDVGGSQGTSLPMRPVNKIKFSEWKARTAPPVDSEAGTTQAETSSTIPFMADSGVSVGTSTKATVFCLLPSFYKREPMRANKFLSWFEEKVSSSVLGALKLVACRDLGRNMLRFGNETACKRSEMLRTLEHQLVNDETITAAGLTWEECHLVFQNYIIVDRLLQKVPANHSFLLSGKSLNHFHESGPIIYTNDGLDPNDEIGLLVWLDWWKATRSDNSHNVVVLKSDAAEPIADEKQPAQLYKSIISESAVSKSHEPARPLPRTTDPRLRPLPTGSASSQPTTPLAASNSRWKRETFAEVAKM